MHLALPYSEVEAVQCRDLTELFDNALEQD